MKHKITTIIIISLALSSLQIYAKKPSKEFSLYGGSGFSFLFYQAPQSITSSFGYNGDIGIGITGFVSQQCGFHIGAGVGLLNIKVKTGDLHNFSSNLTDCNGYNFDLYTTLAGYSEIHKTLSVNVPVLFQFQTKMNQGWNWKKSQKQCYYFMTGIKLHLLFNRIYKAQITRLDNAAYYPIADNWAATQTFVGLGDFACKDADGIFSVGALAMFTFETGIKWRIHQNLYLYTGAYFDCGLNDPTKNYREPVSNYIDAEHLAALSLLSFYNKSALMGIGIKLRLAFFKYSTVLPCR